jgi:hypothetical protein
VQVRQCAVNALTALYSEDTHLLSLQELTGRFLERFLELPFDAAEGVGAAALQLLGTLLQKGQIEADKVRDYYCYAIV